ncbi:MAG: thioredoxin family protein [Phycisphaerae bacterium]|nr:thioredoxin family protein [Phycisphaerae bacterium]
MEWRGDFDAAVAAANDQDALLLLDFWADWCGPCRSLDAHVFDSEEVWAAIAGRFVPVRIDVSRQPPPEQQAKLAFRYRDPVTGQLSLPTVLIVDPSDGSVVGRASDSDLSSPAAMIEFLSRNSARR